MIENQIHTDQFSDAFKQAFDNYQPDFNADDLKADWSGVKSRINPSQGSGINNPQIPKGVKSFLNLKNIIITSVSGVAIVASTVLIVNKQKLFENIPTTAKTAAVHSEQNINLTEQDNPNRPDTITYNDALKENKKDLPVQKNYTGILVNQNTTKNVQIPVLSLATNIVPKNSIALDQQITAPVSADLIVPLIIITENNFPKQDEIYLSDTQFCQNQVVRLSYNFKDPGNQKLFVSLQGEQLNDNNNNFTYKFMKSGWYNLSLTIQNYTATISKSYRIHVVSSPRASFNYSLNESPVIRFYNQSRFADNYHWQFGDNSSGSFDNPYHRYADTGVYKVLLIAATDGVCADTTVKFIHVQSYTEPQIPNTFSPNNDGVNDEFYIKIDNETIYELTIFDRYSTLVFSSRDKNEKWNGNYKDNNKQCPAGTYFYFLNYQITGQDQPVVKTGTITLFR